MIKKYYTLREFCNYSTESPGSALANDDYLETIIHDIDSNLNLPEPYGHALETVFQQYIYPTCWNSYITNITYCEYEASEVDESELADKAFKELAGRIYTWILRTKRTYGESLEFWEANKAKLLEGVKTETNFSDTPQTSSNTYNDNYTSTRTVSTVEQSMIDKLTIIDDRIRDIYYEWYQDFEMNFIL